MHKTVRVFLYRYGDAALLKNYMKALNAAGMEYLVSDRMEESAACDALLLSGGRDSDPRLYGQENRACCGVSRVRSSKSSTGNPVASANALASKSAWLYPLDAKRFAGMGTGTNACTSSSQSSRSNSPYNSSAIQSAMQVTARYLKPCTTPRTGP